MTGILVSFCTVVAAQDSTSKKSYGSASLNFINNSVYSGRKDSLTTPYLTPLLGYYDKSGFFINGSASYLMRSGSSRFDLFSLGAGYIFTAGNFEGEITAEKLFYNNSSTNIKSEVKADIAAMASYDFGFIESSLQPGINFGKKTDYWLSWGLDHRFLPNEKWEITPSFSLNAETRNFYASYFGNRRFRPRSGQVNTTVTASVQDASKLKIMNYEFSLPVIYSAGNFTFGFTPYYSIPANPAVVTVVIRAASGPAVTKIITEKTENIFYFSFDVSWKF